MPRRAPTTLLEVIQSRTGSLRKTFKVGQFIASWAIAREDLGHPLYVHEYSTWWKVSERSAWREMAVFREAFPEEENPDRIAALLIAALPRKVDTAAALSTPPELLALS